MRDDSREPSQPSAANLREQTAALFLGISTTRDVIALAADLLADGHDSPSLTALASLYASATSPEVFDLSSTALVEAGDPPLDRDSEEIPLLALRVACRRFLAGDLDLRAFSSWAHDLIGHDGPEAAQPFVEVDDVLDLHTVSHRSRRVTRRYREEVTQLAATYLASTAAHPKDHR
ncbi:hypothetical protein [Rathayibacter sp. AY1F3]|uniref:hypothetical protein n=1 Tax=Rathayibacter sp. AY1F3 TaxID=2080558 RepID=UPI0011B0CB11|nr:hypothetical protein [Rathayibacter sp. AY1F3]